MRPPHDRGGWLDAGPIDRSEHTLADWERRMHGIIRVLTSPEKRVMRVDEMRRAIESIDPETYESLSYYQRWQQAVEALMVEKGILSHEDVDAKVADLEARGW
jgi:hypothetical protein